MSTEYQKSQQDLFRHQVRKLIRAKRLLLSPSEQDFAAKSIISPSFQLIEQNNAEKLAFYLPFDGEISPLELINYLRIKGKKIYLPVLHPFSANQLLFLEYDDDTDLEKNLFGILQPKLDIRKVLPTSELDMIFTPLVAYDTRGNRLGMGGGFYDRTLAQYPDIVSVGLAHRCQQVDSLPIEHWDIPLKHLIIGESQK
ncbi:5-formyltetrahydrofolate cyclo-ligase [Otariodibacter oris]|uniref:5-formyltetrahydrofolate cyclo-ligase n=1 Tax=Otariodibacter oris TaxID=1032623 RepID=A0A420XEH9_9PAST|nr:5-formyltetrahydrofolate cyclo-ligase [Otariodibacter oris]QGM80174.1 5-formyltetrahydrofolate cyclo-ligase [Otariodibacter oris]RKR70638.1 5-formyltetrahydrofolate cyclo-ligase [Otariodibacter oris]